MTTTTHHTTNPLDPAAGGPPDPSGPPPLLVNIATAADLLALSRSTIYELIWQGELRPIHIGRSVRLTLEQLHSFVARQVARADESEPRRRTSADAVRDPIGVTHPITHSARP